MWHIHAGEYYSSMKKNKITPFATTQVDMEIIILSEVSQTEKDKYHDVTYPWNIKKNCTNELVYEAEIKSQLQETNLRLPGQKGGEG